jgi:hypothetical protein
MSGRPRILSEQKELELVRWWNTRGATKTKASELGISVDTLMSILQRRGAMRLDGKGRLKPSWGSKYRLIMQCEELRDSTSDQLLAEASAVKLGAK